MRAALFVPTMLKPIADALLSLVYPQQCRICNKIVDSRADGIVCSECWGECRFFSGLETICEKCGEFISDSEPLFESFCRNCDSHEYGIARAVGIYQGALAATLIRLKAEPFVPERLARQLCLTFNDVFRSGTTLIVPVPLSPLRYKERGFNQAAVIGGVISLSTGIPMDEFSLVRHKHTPMHRAAMDRKGRETTVKNAFEVKRPKLISGQDILLVDDIFTTGATASYCAKALKKNGAASVNVLTLARAV